MERRRIAQLLHDTVSQSLTGTYLQAVVSARKSRQAGASGTDELTRLAEMIHQVVHELQTVIQGLVPEEQASTTATEQSPGNR